MTRASRSIHCTSSRVLLAGRSARAVGHRHEGGRELAELADRLLERLPSGVGLGWEELEREDPAVSLGEQLRDLFIRRGPRRFGRGAPRTTSAPIVTFSPLRSGASNIRSWQISSTSVRRLRAPVRRRMQCSAMSRSAAFGEPEVDAVHLQQRLVLAHDRVGRAGHDQEELVLGQRIELHPDRQASEELGQQAVVQQLLLAHLAARDPVAGARPPRRSRPPWSASLGRRSEKVPAAMNRMSCVSTTTKSCLFQCWVTLRGAKISRPSSSLSSDCWTPSPPMSRDPRAGARALAAARDLVDLVDEHDPALGALHVLVGLVQELAHHHLDVLAVVAGLRVLGGVGDRERHLEAVGERARDVRLARAGRSEQEEVGLLHQALAGRRRLRAAFQVVVGGDGDRALGALLPDDVAIQVVEDLSRGQELAFGDARVGLHGGARVSHRPRYLARRLSPFCLANSPVFTLETRP